MSIQLRLASLEDRTTIFEWRNDPWIVSLSAGQQPVTWEQHVPWFQKVMAGENHLLYIIESETGTGMGCVRFDRTSHEEAAVTIYLLRDFVGKGFGTLTLREACERAFQHWPAIRRIRAFIRKENTASLRSFAKAGFTELGVTTNGGTSGVEVVLYPPKIQESNFL